VFSGLAMSDMASLVQVMRKKAAGRERFMAAIAGAPGSGKSTLGHNLKVELEAAGESAIVVPMDGFHFDDIILNQRGHRPRKGAPFTFDVRGFEVLLKRIRTREEEVAIPVFDRTLELAKAGADIVDPAAKFILVEGNYLLLQAEPWNRLKPIFDFSVFIDVPKAELERRLIQRWLDHGFDMDYARNWVASNDALNIDAVIGGSAKADFTLHQS
jgi:pantothenate kinase